jgi:hypothetical protein|tara:strand:- start:455 stop:598 length:144 start_codon:yes stop_codon:yes gene_type:complete
MMEKKNWTIELDEEEFTFLTQEEYDDAMKCEGSSEPMDDLDFESPQP